MQRITRRLAALAVALTLGLVALPALAAEAGPKGVVNVNSASAAELERLPGVGPSLAARILEHREQHGAFRAKEDLMLVRGIGEKSYERLAPYVAISGATTLAERVPGERPARKADAADRD
jgi:competence protein ComEA